MNGDGKVDLWHGFDLRNLRFLLLRRPPREEIPDRPFPGFAGYDQTVHQLLRGEKLRCSITEKIEEERTLQGALAVDENVKGHVHGSAKPVTHHERPGVETEYCEKIVHQ